MAAAADRKAGEAKGAGVPGAAAGGAEGRRSDSRTFLEDLALDLSRAAGLLALYAEADAAKREALSIAPATAPQLAALLAARNARNAAGTVYLTVP
jgi:hypothetical protein